MRPLLVGGTASAPVPSCGDLGDLPSGAILTSGASLAPGGGEACDNGVILTPQTLTTATFPSTAPGSAIIRLPNGCTGRFDVSFEPSNGSSSLLDNSTQNGAPTWWLVRRFKQIIGASACFSTATAPPECADAFIAQNVRK